jgi:Sulfotransferase domain
MVSPSNFAELVAERPANGFEDVASYSTQLHGGNGRALELPSFIVVGPPRTGTSWLHEVLNQRANLPKPTKETRFFDLHFARGLKWYLGHFSRANEGCPFGEIAPTYFGSGQARERIATTIPHVKLVFIFRNPAQRLVSLYRLKRAYGMHDWTLEEALVRDPEMVESSLYATNLRKWREAFQSQQMMVNLFDDLSGDPQAFVDRLAVFLNIPRFKLAEKQLKQVYSSTQMTKPKSYLATRVATLMADWCKARRLDSIVAGVRESSLIRLFLGGGAPFPEIPPATMHKLWASSLSETEKLEELIGRDLSHWKRPPSL